ncbi:MAG: hypothetical protein JO090_05945 [Rhizobacter sp.]|nr:hypothetical protein [Rhizobacter sp.]
MTEAARRLAQQLARTRVLAELRHRYAAHRERGGIAAQRDTLERADGIAGDKRAGRGRDEGVHRCRLTDSSRASLISRGSEAHAGQE